MPILKRTARRLNGWTSCIETTVRRALIANLVTAASDGHTMLRIAKANLPLTDYTNEGAAMRTKLAVLVEALLLAGPAIALTNNTSASVGGSSGGCAMHAGFAHTGGMREHGERGEHQRGQFIHNALTTDEINGYNGYNAFIYSSYLICPPCDPENIGQNFGRAYPTKARIH